MRMIRRMMKPSLLALQIALFHHYPTDAAFIQHGPAPALGKMSRRGPAKKMKEARKVYPSLPELDVSVGSSSSSTVEAVEMLPVIPEEERRSRRHSTFEETNAVSRRSPAPHPDLWRRSLPEQVGNDAVDKKPFWRFLLPHNDTDETRSGMTSLNDVSVNFRDPTVGARLLLEKCGIISPPSEQVIDSIPLPETIMKEAETVRHLADVLSRFQSIATPLDISPGDIECTARVVSSIGKVGTKCPRWHADHVPVRLVMSILGPGCEYIPEGVSCIANGCTNACNCAESVVNREALNNLDEDDTGRANDIIVSPRSLAEAGEGVNGRPIVVRAWEGDEVLLMGRAWEERHQDGSECGVLAAVHRSPTLQQGQERILLTVDLAD